jgi:magnesium/cobalt transport protein CorA
MIGGMEVRLIADGGVQRRPVEDLAALLDQKDRLVWVDIPSCDNDAVRVLSEVFKFHPLAIKDCAERNRVPKMHGYSDHILVVLHAPERGDRGHVHYVELDQFIGDNYLVTVHGPVNPAVRPEAIHRETGAVLKRIEAGRLHPRTPLELSYAIVSALARNEEEYVEVVTTDVWRLEQQVTGRQAPGSTEEFLADMFQVRTALLAVRTMGALSSRIYARVAKLNCIRPEERPGVADIADQFDRVRGVADAEREYLQGVIEYYRTSLDHARNEEIKQLTEASYTQNEHVKKISAWAAIAFAPTLIATIYGMNFRHMPELRSGYGYPLVLLAMLVSAAVLYVVFKRRGWL